MRIVFIGAGSMGMLFAGKLAALEHLEPPIMITHQDQQAEQLKVRGLTVTSDPMSSPSKPSVSSDLTIRTKIQPVSFQTASTDEGWKAAMARWNWLFLMVKQFQITESLVQFIAGIMNREDCAAKLICFQNGIGHVEKLAQHIDISRIYTAMTTEGAVRLDHCTVGHKGRGVTIWGPAQSGGEHSPQAQQREYDKKCGNNLLFSLQQAGFDAQMSNNMERYIWNKLLINSVINPLTAIHGVRNGQLLQSPFLVASMRALYREGRALAEWLHIPLSDDLWEQLVQVCTKTANNTSSMLQDIQSGRRTEVEWINGSMIRLAKQVKRSLPCHEKIYAHVLSMEQPHP